MTTQQDPVSTRFLIALLAVFAGVGIAVLVLVVYLGTRPFADSPDDPPSLGPMPASTAEPAPHAPVELTELPIHQRGPQALHALTSTETTR